MKTLLFKVLYGVLFAVIVPAFLIIWARHTTGLVLLPVPLSHFISVILLTAGMLLVISGILGLMIYGNGLPMNAFPPGRFVSKGVYALFKHPVYTGAIFISFGLSGITHSSSGFWLVSPLFTLMVVAYVVGFENERTMILYGKQDHRAFLSLPLSSGEPSSLKEKISVYLLVFLPWFILHKIFTGTGYSDVVIDMNPAIRISLPVQVLSDLLFLSGYLFIGMAPLFIKTKVQLRSYVVEFWFAAIISGILFMAFPFTEKGKDLFFIPLSGHNEIAGSLLHRANFNLPYFHIILLFLSAKYCSLITRTKRVFWFILALFISVSCIVTVNYSPIDIIAGFLLFLIVIQRQKIWAHIKKLSENLANSWQEWRIGPARIINHGFYGGAAGFAGAFLAASFLGKQYAFTCLILVCFMIAGAGLWAQLIEGSPKLLRPFGYYGGVTGLIIGSVFVSLVFSVDFFILLASFAMAAPWIQAIGRLRCLVQGCCHGKPSGSEIGIRFIHPFSRVNKISGLAGVPLYPTQLYSIGTNILTGVILTRMYMLGMPSAFISGLYLILNGLGRFIEESYRGEAQTPYWAGMRIYQWIAIINIFAGALLTAIKDTGTLLFQFSPWVLVFSLAAGIAVTIASGVDFPESERRFARLTS